jgi:hypothetical protein
MAMRPAGLREAWIGASSSSQGQTIDGGVETGRRFPSVDEISVSVDPVESPLQRFFLVRDLRMWLREGPSQSDECQFVPS